MLRCMLSLSAATGMSRSAAMTFGSAWAADGTLRRALYVLMEASCVDADGRYSVQRRDRTGDAAAAFFQNVERGCDRQPEVRRQPVGGAGNDRDANALEQVHHHVTVFGQHFAFRRGPADQARTIDVEIEGAVRRAATQPGNRIDPRQCGITALLVDAHAFGDEALVAVQSGGGRGLA